MKKSLKIIICLFVAAIMVSSFLIYTEMYYHADEEAVAALISDDTVKVSQTGYGWFFDGPSAENVLVFYPGAKVEETAYAPLLHRLSSKGVDVCLVKMPLRFAFFGANKADEVAEMQNYPNRYIGGHSLGGAIAASYAAEHGDDLEGVILLAAYSTKPLDSDLKLLNVYGSEDGVVNMDKIIEGRNFAPEQYNESVIQGGNHAQFGNYGNQKRDGEASISSDTQQAQTVEAILHSIR